MSGTNARLTTLLAVAEILGAEGYTLAEAGRERDGYLISDVTGERFGPVVVRHIAYTVSGHTEAHVRYVLERYADAVRARGYLARYDATWNGIIVTPREA